jgi:siderophore synthetase component
MHCQNAVPISTLVASLQSTGLLPTSFSVQHDVATFSIADVELAPHVSAILRTPIPIGGHEILPAVDLWYGPTSAVAMWSNLTDAELQECWYRYCCVLIEGPVKLLIQYGIAIEPHLQNVYVEFRDRVPHRIIVRDLDHAILDRVAVESPLKELGLRLFPHTWEYMPRIEAGINRLVHDLFHAHISEAILAIAKAGRLSVRWLCQTALDVLEAQRPPPKDVIASERFERIQQSLGTVRALLRMRLENTEEAIYL